MRSKRAKPVGVFVLERQEIYREVYKIVLASNPSINLLGISDSNIMASLVREVVELAPDVIIVGLKKCDGSVITGLRSICAARPQTGIVLLLNFCSVQDAELLRSFILDGGRGLAVFLRSSLDRVEQLYGAISEARQGHVVFDPLLVNMIFWDKSELSPFKELTVREWEILKLLSRGYTNVAIARALCIDYRTVEHHLSSIYSKLRAGSSFNDRHLRVSAARLFMETVGYQVNHDDHDACGNGWGNGNKLSI